VLYLIYIPYRIPCVKFVKTVLATKTWYNYLERGRVKKN